MMLEIQPIPYKDKPVLQNLIQLYRYDSSEFDGYALSQHGLYPYKYLDHQWTDEYRHPFLIKIDEEIAGFIFVLTGVPKEYVKLSTANETNVISDFFINVFNPQNKRKEDVHGTERNQTKIKRNKR